MYGKNRAYKKWIDRPTRSKRLEYEFPESSPLRYAKTRKEYK
jgi:hypothetical protein